MGKKVIGAVLLVVGIYMVATTGSDGGLIQAGGQMLIAAGLSMMITPRISEPNNRRSVKFNPRTAVEPRKLIYGKTIVGGPLVYIETLPGEDKTVEDYLHRIVVLAGHPIEDIEYVQLSDQKVKLGDIDDNFSNFPSDNWKIGDKKTLILDVKQTELNAPDSLEAIKVRKVAGSAWALGGTDSESENNTTVSDDVAINSTRELNECPYLYVRLKLEEDGWNSVPQIRAAVSGKRILSATEIQQVQVANPTWEGKEIIDFMTQVGTTVDVDKNILVNQNAEGQNYLRFNNNSANCILDYLMDEKLGLGIPLEEIDLDSFVSAEGTSDQIVYSQPVTENLKDPGTNNDATVGASLSGIQNFTWETASVRHPIININVGPQTSYLNGTISVTFPDGAILEDYWTTDTATNPAKRGLRYRSGGSGLDQNDFDLSSYIDLDTGLVYVRTTGSYLGGVSGTPTISFTASAKTDSTRYQMNGVISLDTTPIQILEEMLTSCAGMLTYTQGKYKLFAGRWETPKSFNGSDVYLTEEDLAGPIQVRTAIPRNERFNAVRGVFSDKDNDWELTDFPEVKNEAYRQADIGSDDYVNTERTGYIYSDINLPFTTDVDAAKRLAKLFLDRSRQSLSLQVTCKPSALQFSPGDNIYVSLPTLGGGDPTRADFSPASISCTTDGDGNITAVTIADGGLGYLSPPRLTVSGGSPTNEATLIPVLERGTIKDVIVQRPDPSLDSGYDTNTTLNIDIFYDSATVNFWTDKVFKIESWSVNEDGLIEMGLKEDAPGLYIDTEEEFSYDLSPDLQEGAVGRQAIKPQNLRLTTISRERDGVFEAGINASWNPPQDSRTIAYYQAQLGIGTKWQKKITSMSMAPARRDLRTDLAPAAPDRASFTYEWVAASTVTDPGIGLTIPTINIPARLQFQVTVPGSGYKKDTKYGQQGNYLYTTITDDQPGGSGNTARLKLTINPDTGSLLGVSVIEKSGDFNAIGPQTVSGLVNLEEPFYRSEATFTLEESVVDYPSYRTLLTRFGPAASYVFDSDDFSSFTGTLSPFYTTDSVTPNTSFTTGFNNVDTCVRLNAGNELYTDFNSSTLDFSTANRNFSIETVVSITGATGTKLLWQILDSGSSVGLSCAINADTNVLTISNNSGGIITATLSDIAINTPYHIVVTERGNDRVGEYSAKVYVNDEEVGSTNTNYTQLTDLSTIKLGDSTNTGNVDVAIFNVYNKEIIKENVSLIYTELNDTTFQKTDATPLVFGDIQAFTITDIEQPEFNGYKSTIHNARFTSNTTGVFDILYVDEVTSFIPDTNGLPGNNTATFGAYVYNAAKTTWYAIDSIVRTFNDALNPPPPANNVLTFKTPINSTTAFAVGDIVKVFGVYDPNREHPFSGEKLITAVNTSGPDTLSIEWKSPTNGKITQSSSAILDKDEAYMFLDYPLEYITTKNIPKGINRIKFFEGVVNDQEHLVRVRAIDKFNRKSDWIDGSIIADSDHKTPNPIYFEAFDGDRQIQFKFDFTKDTAGVEDGTYHTETNLSHVELVVVKEGTNRPNGLGQDPGARSFEFRKIDTIAVNSNAKAIQDGVVEYFHQADGQPQNRYAWARLVTKSGQVSKWFPDDDGTGDGTDGIGPIRADAGIYNNLIGSDTSDSSSATVVGSTTNDGGGAAPPNDVDDPPQDIPIPYRDLNLIE